MKEIPSDKIVFLDSGTLDFGDLSLKLFSTLGKLTLHSKSSPTQMKIRLKNATHVITNKCRFDAKLLNQLESVQSIHLAATGVNNVDLAAAKKNDIAITNVVGYSTDAVAQFTLALILALAGNLVNYDRGIKAGTWSRSPFFMWSKFHVSEVAGKTLTILGYGHIGRRVARLARALGMRILVCQVPGRRYPKTKLRRVSLAEGLRRADYFTIHTPLSPLTEGLINAKSICTMKPSAYLINTARGGIVVEKELAQALKKGLIAGSAVDVLSSEPPPKNHPLLKAPNMLLTPHMAWATLEVRQRLVGEVFKNIKSFQAGKKRNRVV